MKETLYGLEKGGKVKVWEIETHHSEGWSTITIEHGEMGGVFTKQIAWIDKGKQGRSIAEQADSEAKSKIKKKLDKNYRRTIEELSDLPLLPMLAVDYREKSHRVDYNAGVDISYKFDGLRLLAKCVPSQRDIGKAIKLQSRTGQPYSIPHIEAELLSIMQVGDVLDGEAYLHGECLEDISSAVKRTDTQAKVDAAQRKLDKAAKMEKDPKVSDEVWYKANESAEAEMREALLIHHIRPNLKFVVFDVPSELPWHERLSDLLRLSIRLPEDSSIDVVRYTRVNSHEQMLALHRDAVSRGYEGVMLRNLNGLYESGKRSNDLQKYKEFMDAEFLVTGYTLDLEGQIVWKCKNDLNEDDFYVVFGSEADKAAMLADVEDRLQKYLKIKFQRRYKKTLLPQFPIGLMFRDGQYIDGEFIPNE